MTFEAIAKEWLARQSFTARTRTKAEWMIHDLVVPYISPRPIDELTAPEILAVLRRIEARGRLETCHRAKWRIGQIIRYAVATGRALRDQSGKQITATPQLHLLQLIIPGRGCIAD